MKPRNKLQENKEVTISVRCNFDENDFLRQEADMAGLSISDYIRVRIFNEEMLYQKSSENKKSHFKNEKELLQLVVGTFGLVVKLASKSLTQEEREIIMKDTLSRLKELGYE